LVQGRETELKGLRSISSMHGVSSHVSF
jgi:hypothetical protein